MIHWDVAITAFGWAKIPDVWPEAEALGLKYSAGIWLTHDEEAYEILGGDLRYTERFTLSFRGEIIYVMMSACWSTEIQGIAVATSARYKFCQSASFKIFKGSLFSLHFLCKQMQTKRSLVICFICLGTSRFQSGPH